LIPGLLTGKENNNNLSRGGGTAKAAKHKANATTGNAANGLVKLPSSKAPWTPPPPPPPAVTAAKTSSCHYAGGGGCRHPSTTTSRSSFIPTNPPLGPTGMNPLQLPASSSNMGGDGSSSSRVDIGYCC